MILIIVQYSNKINFVDQFILFPLKLNFEIEYEFG